VRTMGVAFSPGTIPGEGTPAFVLPEDEIEIGLGLHGEPGVRRGKMQPADTLVDQMLELILPDKPILAGDEVCVLIDGFGSTTKMEQWIIMRRTLQVLAGQGIKVYKSVAGSFATCQEMAGFSITLLRLDDELKKYYDYPAWAPVYTNH
jgi:phosphoenolpyruvate---glycerone phosphotransferase subunit DhaK